MFTFNGFLAKLKTKFSTNKTPTNNHRFPLVLPDGTPDGNATPADVMQFLGALGNHTKDKGTAKLEDYKNVSCSFNIGTSELQDATNWTDFPSDGRMFSYFINLNFGGNSCLQFLFNERTGTGIGIYFRNYNAGAYEMKPWRKVQIT